MANFCEYAFGALCPAGCLIHECSIVPVGGECEGGKVAHHDGAGGGIIAASADNSTGIEWGCSETSVGASGTAIGTGLSNTSAILAGCATRPIAASVCDAYDGGGYNDWFLPSKDELTLLYASKGVVGGYASEWYWSSSEDGTDNAWSQTLSYGDQTNSSKNNIYRVRCVRTLHVCGDNITDSRDSQVYTTVEIGTQCWMAENLAYLPSVVGPATGSTTNPYYYVYGYDGTDVSAAKATANYTDYGVLYNWAAAMDGDTVEGSQGICPTGWHLPTDAEQHTLDAYLATGTCDPARATWGCDPAGTKMKTSAWGGDNSSGFTALAGGYRAAGSFDYLGTAGAFWSSSSSGSNAWYRLPHSDYSTVRRYAINQYLGFSVRCLRN